MCHTRARTHIANNNFNTKWINAYKTTTNNTWGSQLGFYRHKKLCGEKANTKGEYNASTTHILGYPKAITFLEFPTMRTAKNNMLSIA